MLLRKGASLPQKRRNNEDSPADPICLSRFSKKKVKAMVLLSRPLRVLEGGIAVN